MQFRTITKSDIRWLPEHAQQKLVGLLQKEGFYGLAIRRTIVRGNDYGYLIYKVTHDSYEVPMMNGTIEGIRGLVGRLQEKARNRRIVIKSDPKDSVIHRILSELGFICTHNADQIRFMWRASN